MKIQEEKRKHGYFEVAEKLDPMYERAEFNLVCSGGERCKGFYTQHLREDMNEKRRAYQIQRRGEGVFSPVRRKTDESGQGASYRIGRDRGDEVQEIRKSWKRGEERRKITFFSELLNSGGVEGLFFIIFRRKVSYCEETFNNIFSLNILMQGLEYPVCVTLYNK